jgi:hypothetical protein
MAFGHAVACGIGHFRIATDYCSDDSFDQEIQIKRIQHPLSVYWDPNAVEPTRHDAEYCVVSELIDQRKFKEQYPKASVTGFDMPANDYFNKSYLYWTRGDFLRIAEYWKKVPVTRTLALLENGKTLDVTDFKPGQLGFLPKIVRERKVESYKIQQWLMSGAEILDGPNDWAGKYIPIVPVIGGEVPLDDKVVRYGLVRFARDPQQLYNFWRSAAAETIALAPKAPFLATPTMIAKFKGQWDTQNTVNRPYLLYEPDQNAPGGMPQRVAPPPIPAAFLQESNIASDELKATTGIYDASLGQRSNETSGRAIIARDHQGDVGTYLFHDNASASLVHAGRIIIDLIPKIYDTERVIKLHTEEHEEPKFATVNKLQMAHDGRPIIANDLSAGKFDIRVRIGPSFATRRMEAVDSLMRFIQAFPQAASVAGDIIVALLDIPKAEELAERLKRMIPPQVLGDDQDPEQQQAQQAAQQQQAQQQQIQQMMMQLEAQLKNAQAQKLSAGAAESQANTRLKNADASLREAQAAIAQMHAVLQQHGINVNQPDQGYPSVNGVESPSQGVSQHQAAHADYQSSLKSAMDEQKLREMTALANQAEARTQSSVLDIALKNQKLKEPGYSGY